MALKNSRLLKVHGLVVLIFFIATFCACQESSREEAPDVPAWLREKISEMQDRPYYAGAAVFRHEWKSAYHYYISIPLSSCLYCDVYDADGKKIDWSVESVEEYIHNRTNETLIWKREMKE